VGLCFLVEGIAEAHTHSKEEGDPSSPLPNLQELLLSYNYIGREGLLALVGAMSKGLFPSLKRLALAHNALEEPSTLRAVEQACGERLAVQM
jgi:hypothetical protein